MRNGSYDVRAKLQRTAHQRFAVRKGLDALLREGDQLECHLAGYFVAHLEQSAQRG